jgi:hypothetical protein
LIARLVARTAAAIEKLRARGSSHANPDPLDLPGLAWLLQGCYSEIEEVLKGIAGQFDEEAANAGGWHRNLLEAMSLPTAKRRAVISEARKQDLDQYLGFRHVALHATFPDIDANKLAPLLDRLSSVVSRFAGEVEAFLSAEGL